MAGAAARILDSRRSIGTAMDHADLADADCVERARDGDGAAMAELVHRYAAGIFNLLSRVLGNRDDATDGTQEVFLRVQRHISTCDPSQSFKTWIYTIAWNLARDQLRRRRRARDSRILSLDAHLRSRETRDARNEPADRRERHPEDRLLERERAEWLRDALDSLEPAQRALLILRELEDLSHEALAAILAVPIGTVKSRLHRARGELKDALMALRPDWIDAKPPSGEREERLGW